MMNATVIDTLRFADRLKAAGFEALRAEGLARALGDELADRMLTRNDLDETRRAIDARFDAMDARFMEMEGRFDAKFETVDAKFGAMDAKFGAMDAKFDAMNTKFDAMNTKFDAMNTQFDAMNTQFDAMNTQFDAMNTQFDAMDTKVKSVHRELSGKFNILVSVMALGFTLLVGLGTYNAVSPRWSDPRAETPATATTRPPAQADEDGGAGDAQP